MSRTSFARYGVLCCLCILSISAHSQSFIRVASFNIAEFGEGSHPQTRDLQFIAQMLTGANLDLIAIQEVGTSQAADQQVTALTQAMNLLLGASQPNYFSFVTPQTGDERYAYIFRSPVIRGDDLYWLDDDKEPGNPGAGGKTFFRIPVAVEFTANDFDFVIVNCHLSWGNTVRRKKEFIALKKFMRAEDPGEDDWLVLGDTNRYGKFSAGSSNRPFDQMLKGNWSSRYRFPLLEALTDPDDMKVYHVASDSQSTTIAASRNVYDQFIITVGMANELGTTTPALAQEVGIIAFDMQTQFNNLDHNAIKYRVSDHRPIWIRLRIDLPDDD